MPDVVEKIRDPIILEIVRQKYREKWGDEPAEFDGKAFTIDEAIENIKQDTEDGRMIVRILSERLKPSTLEQAFDEVFSKIERIVLKLFSRE